ncbi:MAG TPA: HAD family hydrolase [Longimicrobiaceae bacterium]|nr:HAD family hydrolase [Longimicrobiaceae bacterium]
MVRALVFDFDGLVFDSETHEYAVVREIFREHGADLPLELWGTCVGTHDGAFDAHGYLEECTGRTLDREAIVRLRRERFYAAVEGHGPLPGVEAMLDAAREMGLRIGLASSSRRGWVVGQLGRLGLLPYFDALRTADDVARVKPDPELYLSACDALGVAPHEAVAFEDSPNGALAAKRAGMRCVVVPNSVTAALAFGEHDMRLGSLLEVELAALLARLAPPTPD